MATLSARSGATRLGFLQSLVQLGCDKKKGGWRSCVDSGINPPDCWGQERSNNNANDEPSSHLFKLDETAMTHDGMYACLVMKVTLSIQP